MRIKHWSKMVEILVKIKWWVGGTGGIIKSEMRVRWQAVWQVVAGNSALSLPCSGLACLPLLSQMKQLVATTNWDTLIL